LRVWGSGFGVQGLGFRVWGLGFGLPNPQKSQNCGLILLQETSRSDTQPRWKCIHGGRGGVNVGCMRWSSNPSGKCSQERLIRGTVTSTMRRAGHPSGRARCGAGAGCLAIKYQSLSTSGATLEPCHTHSTDPYSQGGP